VIEAELKARLSDPGGVRSALAGRSDGERATYHDTYFDTPEESLERDGKELRLRTVESAGSVRHMLTVKEQVFDATSGSKPEHETSVAEPAAVVHMLKALGYGPVIDFTKHCENYRFTAQGLQMLATVVVVPEIDGTFLEVESLVEERDVESALGAIRTVMTQLGVDHASLTTELYTDAVRAARRH
jgi:adenylate cyclase class 2